MSDTPKHRIVPFDLNGIVDWLVTAAPGQMVAYYRGHLAHDRTEPPNVLTPDVRRKLSHVADRLLKESDCGAVVLLQRRMGPHDWLYLAARTTKPLSSLAAYQRAA